MLIVLRMVLDFWPGRFHCSGWAHPSLFWLSSTRALRICCPFEQLYRIHTMVTRSTILLHVFLYAQISSALRWSPPCRLCTSRQQMARWLATGPRSPTPAFQAEPRRHGCPCGAKKPLGSTSCCVSHHIPVQGPHLSCSPLPPPPSPESLCGGCPRTGQAHPLKSTCRYQSRQRLCSFDHITLPRSPPRSCALQKRLWLQARTAAYVFG